MHANRISGRATISAAAALAVAAVLAGPVLAGGDSGPSARTGNIHQDCDQFSTQSSGDSFLLKANCRTSDDNENKKATSINLATNIGNANGNLTWNGNSFHKSCNKIAAEQHNDGVKLKARCSYEYCRPPNQFQDFGCQTKWRNTSLELSSYYEVNSSGDLAVK